MTTKLQTEYRESTEERLEKLRQSQPAAIQEDAIDRSVLDRLETMPIAELRVLIERVFNARWGNIALMTKQQRVEAAKLKLWHAGLTQEDMFKALPVLREAFDREEGKAAQSIAMKVENTALSTLSSDRLLFIERELARVTGQAALVILPEPSKLED